MMSFSYAISYAFFYLINDVIFLCLKVFVIRLNVCESGDFGGFSSFAGGNQTDAVHIMS